MSKNVSNSICVIYDEVAKTHSAPLTFANDACAIRYFNTKKADPNMPDYRLYKVAEYEPETGKLEVLPESVLLIRGDQVIYDKEEK